MNHRCKDAHKGIFSLDSEPVNHYNEANLFGSVNHSMKEGRQMATKLRRFTVSVTPEIEVDLNSIKQEYFYNDTRAEMIRELIKRGLTSYKAEDQQAI